MEYRSGNIYLRTNDFMLETGHVVEGHKHNFDHTTFFGAGKWLVEAFGEVFEEDGVTPKYEFENKLVAGELVKDKKPVRVKLREVTIQGGYPHSHLLIEAGLFHRLTLLEGPGTYTCIYSHRTPDGEVTEEYTGWARAYG